VDGLLKFASQRAVTVLHAPAGFGKTTAVLSWLQASDARSAWLKLDSFDNDPRRLATHVFAALDAGVPGLGADALHAAEGGSDLLETCTPLLGEAVKRIDPVGSVFVLDDFHALTEGECQDVIRGCVRAVMRSMRTVITSRNRPPLRLRASDISMITARELAFRSDDAERLLNGSYQLGLSGRQLQGLEAQVGGWPVGLSLLAATYAMQSQSDAAAAIEHQLTSPGRGALADYVIQEMLDQLKPGMRDFMLKTSVLERMTEDLCVAVMQDPQASRLLAEMATHNYVTVEGGEDGRWVRNHELVRSVLEEKLWDEDPSQAKQLHRRAASWYADHRRPAEAIDHAISADDGHFAAAVIAANATDLIHSGQYTTLRRALAAAPSDRGELGPLLEALDINLTIRSEGADFRGARARAAALAAEHGERADVMRLCDDVLVNSYGGDVSSAVEAGRRALRRDRDDPVLGPRRAVQLGQALWFAAEFEGAKQLTDPYLTVTEPLLIGVYARGVRALIHSAEGEVHAAEAMVREAVALVSAAGAETSIEFVALSGAFSEVLRAAGKLEDARARANHYLAGRELAQPGSIAHAIALTLDARVAVAERRRQRARSSIERARKIFADYRDPGPLLSGWVDEVERALAGPADEALLGTQPTAAEMRVVELLAEGLSRGEIADRLYLSDATVKSHLRRIYRRFGVSSREHAVIAAQDRGLI
jgi:LuxR family transcriptional regulator, maltose regulon positive regulatory protein